MNYTIEQSLLRLMEKIGQLADIGIKYAEKKLLSEEEKKSSDG